MNAADLNARGWAIMPDEAGSIFLELSAPSMVPIIETHVGPLLADWARHDDLLEKEAGCGPTELKRLADAQATGQLTKPWARVG